MGGNLFKNPGFKSLLGRSNFFVPFSFHFHILHKNWILTHKIRFLIFFYQLNINKNSCIEKIYFYVTCKYTKKVVVCFNIQFFMDKMKKVKMKRKMAKNLTLPHWDSNPRFLNKTFPHKIWILREIRSIELTVLKKSRLYTIINIRKCLYFFDLTTL